jgi:hypothetical protein
MKNKVIAFYFSLNQTQDSLPIVNNKVLNGFVRSLVLSCEHKDVLEEAHKYI